ncbi:uncharacterized protein [Eurosta solidaginis]|uniref:uncharacterized protein isoform X2 n=1 Tax=Eurosta solidaginis TaxID=178769 RepID=UPI00353134FC
MQLLRNFTTLINLIGLSTVDQRFAEIFKKMCEASVDEYSISTFIYTRHENEAYDAFRSSKQNLDITAILQTLHAKDPVAVMNIYENTSVENYSQKFNRNLMSIVQLTQNPRKDKKMLQTLWKRLHWNRQSFLVLLFDDIANENYVSAILRFCAKEKAINVIGLQPYLAVFERSYCTLRLFPKEEVIKQTFVQRYQNLFYNQIQNMQGYPLRAIGIKSPPELYQYTTKDGATVLSGYAAKAVRDYARRHNATLEFQIGNNLKANISTGLVTVLQIYNSDIGPIQSLNRLHGIAPFSTVINYGDACLMIPMETSLPKFSYYYLMMRKSFVFLFCFSVVIISCIWALILRWNCPQHVKFIDYILNLYVFQVLLGATAFQQRQIVGIQKLISIIISFAGVVFGTAYVAYLQSFTMDAPTETEAKSIEDLLRRGIKIAIPAVAKPLMMREKNYHKCLHNFTFFNNDTELFLLRDSFDTRYAFVKSNMWPLLEALQKYFSKPLFRSSDICFHERYQQVFHMSENSIYHQSLNYFILKLREAGLIDHWWRHSFIELLEMDVISLEDRNKQSGFQPLKLNDLRLIFIGLGVMWVLCICCFVLELFWIKIQKAMISSLKYVKVKYRLY